MGVVAVADQKPVLALDRFGRADEIVARQGRGDHAVHRGGADLIALVPGAVDQKLQRARGLAAGDTERGDDLRFRQPEQFRRRRRGAIGARGRGRMEAARIMRGGIERIAEPAADFIARDDRGQHVAPGAAGHFADRERRRHHRRARMQRGIGMGIVEIKRMAERAVEQRRDRRRPGLAVAEYRRARPCRRAPALRASSASRASIPRRAAPGSRCRGNPASAPWRAPALRGGISSNFRSAT